jgi:hypothetical protein
MDADSLSSAIWQMTESDLNAQWVGDKLRRRSPQEAERLWNERWSLPAEERQRLILSHVPAAATGRWIGSAEIVEATHLHSTVVSHTLQRLKEMGLVENGRGRAGMTRKWRQVAPPVQQQQPLPTFTPLASAAPAQEGGNYGRLLRRLVEQNDEIITLLHKLVD